MLLDIRVFIAFLILAFLYALMYLFSKKLLGGKLAKKKRFTQEIFKNYSFFKLWFKELALLNLGKKLLKIFKSISKKYMIIQLVRSLIISYPRYLFRICIDSFCNYLFKYNKYERNNFFKFTNFMRYGISYMEINSTYF